MSAPLGKQDPWTLAATAHRPPPVARSHSDVRFQFQRECSRAQGVPWPFALDQQGVALSAALTGMRRRHIGLIDGHCELVKLQELLGVIDRLQGSWEVQELLGVIAQPPGIKGVQDSWRCPTAAQKHETYVLALSHKCQPTGAAPANPQRHFWWPDTRLFTSRSRPPGRRRAPNHQLARRFGPCRRRHSNACLHDQAPMATRNIAPKCPETGAFGPVTISVNRESPDRIDGRGHSRACLDHGPPDRLPAVRAADKRASNTLPA